MPDQLYDDQGNPIRSSSTTYDDQGKPIASSQEPQSWLQRQIEGALGLPMSSLDPVKHAVSAIVDQAKKHPAAAGAMIAGTATAPMTGGMSLPAAAGFSALMAGGGAGAGLLAHDAANPDDMTGSADAAKQIGVQGALGAGGEAVSRGISAAAPAVSQWLYKLGLAPSKSLTSNFPTAAETGLSEGVQPTEAAIQTRLSQIESSLSSAVQQSSAPVPTASVAAQARDYVLKKAKLTGPEGRGLRAEAIQQVDGLVQQYLKENPASLSITESLGQKRAEQDLATTAYNSEARGGTINQIEALWHQGLANANRQAVVSRVPSAADDLAREQGLLGLKAMAKSATDRPSSVSPVTAAAVLGAAMYGHPEVALGYAALTAAMKSPTLTGALGLGINKLSALGANGLTPALTKALAAAYGGYAQSDPNQEDQP